MTDEPPAKALVENVKADLRAVSWQHRLQTMLLTLGILAFGFMLGVHFFAAHTFSMLPPLQDAPEYAPLQRLYRDSMDTGLFVAGGALVVGFALELRGRDDE